MEPDTREDRGRREGDDGTCDGRERDARANRREGEERRSESTAPWCLRGWFCFVWCLSKFRFTVIVRLTGDPMLLKTPILEEEKNDVMTRQLLKTISLQTIFDDVYAR